MGIKALGVRMPMREEVPPANINTTICAFTLLPSVPMPFGKPF
jgi:hypothetical protein